MNVNKYVLVAGALLGGLSGIAGIMSGSAKAHERDALAYVRSVDARNLLPIQVGDLNALATADTLDGLVRASQTAIVHHVAGLRQDYDNSGKQEDFVRYEAAESHLRTPMGVLSGISQGMNLSDAVQYAQNHPYKFRIAQEKTGMPDFPVPKSK
ncbi:MAG: hypothetical protein Q7S65_02045 [Nanoarchaeota archaeon]|nr:hypothetical protein [Nanoarchaeota archaeon]